jgi:hypothetical protein
MKIGDLVRCIWQPGVSCIVNDRAMPMEYTIKDEVGFIIDMDSCNDPRYTIIFPQFDGYTHWLSTNAFEVIQ